MELAGSCHCKKVTFTVKSHAPVPFMRCFCSICVKCNGSGGYGINIMGETDSLKVEGMENVKVYNAIIDYDPSKKKQKTSEAKRHFCSHCGSHLWLHDDKWAQWVYPYASAIDTPLPKPPQSLYVKLDSKVSWVDVPKADNVTYFDGFPQTGLEDWHKENGLWVE